ncbi:MAG: hypothetical protein LBI30_03665, partial [Holosporales bacterium]|nr:hypothetical protein [Holosporales bacterium]
QNFQALDKFTDDFAKSSGCQVIGTSFPTENLIAQDFYDTIHLKKSGLNKMFNANCEPGK